jgi:fructuronate reductase
MHHRLAQIATDSSLKIPERWLTPLRQLRAAGHATPMLASALAAWARHTREGELDDPAADRLRQARRLPRREALRDLLRTLGAADLAEDSALVKEVDDRFEGWSGAGRSRWSDSKAQFSQGPWQV